MDVVHVSVVLTICWPPHADNVAVAVTRTNYYPCLVSSAQGQSHAKIDAGVEFVPVVAKMLGDLSEGTIRIIRSLTTICAATPSVSPVASLAACFPG